MKYIDEVSFQNKRIILRVDFNVAMSPSHAIADDIRIRQAIPTINLLLKGKNHLLIITHLDRPKGYDPTLSLQPICEKLQSYFPDYTVLLVKDIVKNGNDARSKQKDNQILVSENIRFYKEEQANDQTFAKNLATLGDVYVNDCFSVCHRNDASIVSLPHFLPSFGGLVLKNEMSMLTKTLDNPKRPLVSVIGGSKISTKIKLIDKLLDLSDSLLIGGGLANNFFKAIGNEIGKSIYEPMELEHTLSLLKLAKTKRAKLLLPLDVYVGNAHDASTKGVAKSVTNLLTNDTILDIGPLSQDLFRKEITSAQTIIWNGPVGFFENEQYRSGTNAVYDAIVSNNQAVSVVGGGDTIAAIAKQPDLSKITHISTGGGAMLAFIEDHTLPGIQALETTTGVAGQG